MKKMMKSKGMKRGGKTKAKGMAKGGMRGGRKMPMMKKGGRAAMKSKGYAKGGAAGGKKKTTKKPTMTVAQIRAAAKAKGFKLVKA
tara:strand:- start:101 stop:358 length:258 start_codon:yes stop_codon:yes gene_type:complete